MSTVCLKARGKKQQQEALFIKQNYRKSSCVKKIRLLRCVFKKGQRYNCFTDEKTSSLCSHAPLLFVPMLIMCKEASGIELSVWQRSVQE